MSSAILKFQPAAGEPQQRVDTSIILAALDELPEAFAIYEDASLLYSNRRFHELWANGSIDAENGRSDMHWHEIPFQMNGRHLTLRVQRPDSTMPGSPQLALIGRMVGGVAHDFNNLLTGILLYCDLLQTKLTPSNSLWQKIDEIRLAAEQGARLIRQLMAVGRDDQGAPRAVYLNRAISDVIPLLRHLVGEHVAVSTSLDDSAGSVAISLAAAQQIVLNLVLNARDAMPSGGAIGIETRLRDFEGTGPGKWIVELAVSDSGTGMDAKTTSRIFEPFFTTKENGTGTGMGLATVRRIVDEAGGMICVDTAPGKGTRMILRLPQVEPDSHPYPLEKLPDAAQIRNDRGDS